MFARPLAITRRGDGGVGETRTVSRAERGICVRLMESLLEVRVDNPASSTGGVHDLDVDHSRGFSQSTHRALESFANVNPDVVWAGDTH